MPSYTSDDRHVIEYTVTRTDERNGKQVDSSTLGGYRLQGRVKKFSGSNQGKFIPGQYRVNSMTASRTDYIYDNSDVVARYHQGYRTLRVDISGYLTQQRGFKGTSIRNDTWDPALMGYAVQRAHAELLSNDMDVGEFLAELPSTIAMVRGGVRLLQKGITNASRNGFTWSRADRARRALLAGKSLASLPRKISNAWLTWRYGIRPLIWDVQGLIKIANGVAIESDFSGLRRRRARVSRSRTEMIDPYLIPVFDRVYMEAKEVVELEQKGEAVVYFEYGAGFGQIDYVLHKYGLHPNQMPYLLWQLVPLSFMLDWFVDVGTWVKAITPKWGFKILGCSASQKTSTRISRISTMSVSPPYTAVNPGPTHDKCIVESIDRREQTLSGEIPHLKPKIVLSVEQQADLLAVLLQRALSNRRH